MSPELSYTCYFYELFNYCDKFFFGCAHFLEVYKPIVLAIPVADGQDNDTL